MSWLALKLIAAYRYLASPWVGNQCRFYPSCSAYAETAIIHFGFLKGSYLIVRRLLKCQPWHPGGFDYVPGTEPDDSKLQACSHSHSATTKADYEYRQQ